MKRLHRLSLRLLLPAVLVLFAALAGLVAYRGTVALAPEVEPAARLQYLETTALLAGVAVLFSWLLDHAVSRRVDHLVGVTARLAEGHLETRAEVTGSSEFAGLAGAINDMASRIERALAERRRSEQEAQQSRAFLQAVVDAIACHIAVLDERHGAGGERGVAALRGGKRAARARLRGLELSAGVRPRPRPRSPGGATRRPACGGS